MFKNCQFLLSFHLSDNDITKDKEHYYKCLEAYGVAEADLIEINRS